MALAVLQRKAGVKTHHRDVYVSTVGGIRLADPGADLAVAIAVTSATGDWRPTLPFVALGEVGLSGDVRRVAGVARRLAEAERLGIKAALVPRGSGCGSTAALRVVEVGTVADALDVVWKSFADHSGPTDLRAWKRKAAPTGA
jgi:DNA repair protein RadA/Sms